MDGLLLEACEGLQAAKHSCVQVLPHTRSKGVTKELEANSLPTLSGGGVLPESGVVLEVSLMTCPCRLGPLADMHVRHRHPLADSSITATL